MAPLPRLASLLRPPVLARLASRAALIVAAGAAAGLLLLVIADSLVPMGVVRQALLGAAERGELGDGLGHERTMGFALSQFSECTALSVAASDVRGTPQFSLRSRAVLWRPGTNICDTAVAAAADPSAAQWFDYSRYWHGYRVALFPLTAAVGLRPAGAILGIIALAAAATLFITLIPTAGAVATGIAFLVIVGLTDLPLTYVIPTHAISLTVLFGGVAVYSLVQKTLSWEAALGWAFALGCAYNYFDFFYNPGAFAMLLSGSVVLTASRSAPDPVSAMPSAIAVAIASLAGYGLFWAAKWAISALLYVHAGADFPILPGDFSRWAAGGAGPYVPLKALARLVRLSVNEPAKLLIWLAALAFLAIALAQGGRRTLRALVAMAGPLVVGAATVEAASAHSIAHAAFTFRIVPLALALLVLAAGAALVRSAQGRASRGGRMASPSSSGCGQADVPPAQPRAGI
jgi:hypothetical protein